MNTRWLDILGGVGWVILGLLVFLVFVLLLPKPISSPQSVRIERGMTVREAANQLEAHDIVVAAQPLVWTLQLQKSSVQAGTYRFASSTSPIQVSRRLTTGDFRTQQLSVTVPEGFTRQQIAERVGRVLPHIDKQDFLQASRGLEGYLYPDTYRLYQDTTAQELVKRMRTNFEDQIKKLKPEFADLPYTQGQIITMASIVGKEAAEFTLRRKVAGVLWNRFDRSMPLQADAVLTYVTGRASSELTQKDLEMDSPYNVYRRTGLPPTPIGNFGIDAIRATVNPIRSKNLYYLTGNDGEFYFAQTLREHRENKRKYLR